MGKPRKSWTEKLADSKGLPKVGHSSHMKSERWRGTFVVPAPAEVDAVMRRVPRGKLITTEELRGALAKKHGTDFACPLTTGIFTWIAANAAAEQRAAGGKDITPYWRTLKAKGELNPKYPGGVAGVAALLKGEGHEVVQKGKRAFVTSYVARLCAL